MRYNINAIYFCIDEFCKIYQQWQRSRLISGNQIRIRNHKMSLGEMLTVMVIATPLYENMVDGELTITRV